MTPNQETDLDLKQFGLVTDICTIDEHGDEDDDGELVLVVFDTNVVIILPVPMMETAVFNLSDEMEDEWKPKQE